jgi:general secretion pathway protein G
MPFGAWRRSRATDGYSFVELLVVTFMILVLASAALPVVRVSIKRQREAELKRDLKDMRTAIDKFHDYADLNRISATELNGTSHYPTSLDQLVQGVTFAGDASGNKYKFLRRIPIDPMTGTTDWGLRSFEDSADSNAWGGQDVFDVYTKAPGKALDGTKYRDW